MKIFTIFQTLSICIATIQTPLSYSMLSIKKTESPVLAPYRQTEFTPHENNVLSIIQLYKDAPFRCKQKRYEQLQEEINLIDKNRTVQIQYISQKLTKIKIAAELNNLEQNATDSQCVTAMHFLHATLLHSMHNDDHLFKSLTKKICNTIPVALMSRQNNRDFEKKIYFMQIALSTYNRSFQPGIYFDKKMVKSEIIKHAKSHKYVSQEIVNSLTKEFNFFITIPAVYKDFTQKKLLEKFQKIEAFNAHKAILTTLIFKTINRTHESCPRPVADIPKILLFKIIHDGMDYLFTQNERNYFNTRLTIAENRYQ